jgi:hypothetical protein
MSAVPPNITASILQGSFAQRQVAIVRDAEQNERTSADRQQARAVDQADSTVETTDDATSIFTDSEGAGSQGRAFSGSPDETPEPEPSEPETDGDEGHIIDLSA